MDKNIVENSLTENNLYLLNESYDPNYKRKYQCPYCEIKTDKMKLIKHIENKHIEMLPEGFTPARKVFNIINKKEYGTCVISGKKTKWNEEKMRYERFYSKKEAEIYKQEFRKKMIDKYGKEHRLDEPEIQKMMLSNRKISGEYKFQDGGIHTYVGSNEKERLDFMDKIMNIPSSDIITPGPVIEYTYKGETHFWITDAYYIPYNLVIDDKDGGSNPNTHEGMKENKAKQIAKEKAIAKLNKYNYIRLTDKQFDQLMYVMMLIKKSLKEEEKRDNKIIKINEVTMGDMNSKFTNDKVYFVQYTRNDHSIEGIGLSPDILLSSLFIIDPNTLKIEYKSLSEMKDYKFILYRYTGKNRNIENIINNKVIKPFLDNRSIYDPNFLANIFLKETGDMIETPYDLSLSEYCEFCLSINDIEEYNPLSEIKYDKKLGVKLIEENDKISASKKLRNRNDIVILENSNGYYLSSLISNRSSDYFSNINDIPGYIVDLIDRGY